MLPQQLFDKLKEEKAFWSYDPSLIDVESISDEMLISMTLRHLDIEEIKLLEKLYTRKFIKSTWVKYLIPEGEYLLTLNRFIAWYFFDIKQPDIYIKSMETRHFNKMLQNA